MFPQIALSEHEKRQKTWTDGDLITTRVLCKTEDAILELTNANKYSGKITKSFPLST